MEALISILFHGLAYAMILYIVSVGLSVTMGLMGFVNLAHGVFAMAGGYVAIGLMNRAGIPFFLAVAIAFLVVAVASMALERTLYARLYGAAELDQVLFTIGLVFMAGAAARFLAGSLPMPVHLPDYLRGQIAIAGRPFPTYRSFLIVGGAVVVTALWLGLERTRFGAQ